jgi:hypothetical protein
VDDFIKNRSYGRKLVLRIKIGRYIDEIDKIPLAWVMVFIGKGKYSDKYLSVFPMYSILFIKERLIES